MKVFFFLHHREQSGVLLRGMTSLFESFILWYVMNAQSGFNLDKYSVRFLLGGMEMKKKSFHFFVTMFEWNISGGKCNYAKWLEAMAILSLNYAHDIG